eukprot:TRINITY_DN175_c0_g2_i2.p1 TRINITY_DN175_c0_g2~~TRINITY_DN175_c0_g2_i2.p1  ORF type:complete len:175 (+),score=5.94 TRINITY_DN175_c0_g2_i2:1984-2508(+)
MRSSSGISVGTNHSSQHPHHASNNDSKARFGLFVGPDKMSSVFCGPAAAWFHAVVVSWSRLSLSQIQFALENERHVGGFISPDEILLLDLLSETTQQSVDLGRQSKRASVAAERQGAAMRSRHPPPSGASVGMAATQVQEHKLRRPELLNHADLAGRSMPIPDSLATQRWTFTS